MTYAERLALRKRQLASIPVRADPAFCHMMYLVKEIVESEKYGFSDETFKEVIAHARATRKRP